MHKRNNQFKVSTGPSQWEVEPTYELLIPLDKMSPNLYLPPLALYDLCLDDPSWDIKLKNSQLVIKRA